MGVLYDYFRAPGAAEVRAHMAANDARSPVPDPFDGIELKAIDPSVILGRLIGFATAREWSPDIATEKLIWPEGGEQDTEYEGPWVTVLGDFTRDTLAAVPPDQIPALAAQWATTE